MPCRVDEPLIERSPEEWDRIRREREERERKEDNKKRAKFAKEDAILAFAQWVETADELTHRLDIMREEILSGKQPTITALDNMDKLTTKLIIAWNSNTRKRGLKRAHEKLLRQRDIITAYNLGASDKLMDAITRDQEEHRREDIERVINELETRHPAEGTKDWERLKTAQAADITKPLIPQLGFDPDDV